MYNMSDSPSSRGALRNDAFAFLDKRAYFSDLVARISRTHRGDRVLLVTHDLELDDPLAASVLRELAAAGARGVSASFALDDRTFPVMRRIPVTRTAHRRILHTHAVLGDLRAAGVAYTITNQVHTPYARLTKRFSGRAHIKLAIVNDTVYVGGCNLTDASMLDMMVRWRDARAADWLYTQMSGIIRSGSTQAALGGQDRELCLDARTGLLLDGGKPRQSIIFDRALALIDEAQEWIVVTCQFFPQSIAAQHLAAAHRRGVRISFYYNHPGKHKPGFSTLFHAAIAHGRIVRPASLYDQQLPKRLPFLHAKLLATEKGAIVGSHNYMPSGVNMGTAELALYRHDSAFAQAAVDCFHQQLTAAQERAKLRRHRSPALQR